MDSIFHEKVSEELQAIMNNSILALILLDLYSFFWRLAELLPLANICISVWQYCCQDS